MAKDNAKHIRALRARRQAAGLCWYCPDPAVPGKRMCQTHLDRNNELGRLRRVARRQRVLDHYGHRCACAGCPCPEPGDEFLTIDHVNGGGRAEYNAGATRELAARVIREGFPAHYQILCWNCNAARHFNGGICPHVIASDSCV